MHLSARQCQFIAAITLSINEMSFMFLPPQWEMILSIEKTPLFPQTKYILLVVLITRSIRLSTPWTLITRLVAGNKEV